MSSLKSFFEDLGTNLYEFKENDYFLVNLEELDRKVTDSKSGFSLLTSENYRRFKNIPSIEVHPVFETEEKIYLLKKVDFKDGEFLISCLVADVDDEDNTRPEVISLENLIEIYRKG